MVWDEARSGHVSTLSIGYTQSTLYTTSGSISTVDYDEISSVTWARATRSLTDRSSFALSTTAIDNIYMAYVESTITVKDALMDIHAEAVGASTGGGGSTAVFYSPNSSVARITATVSSDGNRNSPVFNRT
jgi:hypothetical protein